MAYSWTNVDSKGTTFIVLTYLLLIVSGAFLIVVLVMRLFAKNQSDSLFFYAQKVKATH